MAGFLVMTGGVTALSGVSSSTAGAATAAKCKAPPTVVFGDQAPGTATSSDVAQGIGAFAQVEKECHTKITVDTFNTAAPMLAGAQSGQVDFLLTSAGTLIPALVQGAQLTVLANVAQGGLGVIVSTTPPTNKGTQALKGYPTNATWAVTSLGAAAQMYDEYLLKQSGLDPTQASFVGVGVSGVGPAVAGKKVLFATMPASTAAQLIVGGQGYEVVNTSGPASYKLTGFIPGWSFESTPSFIKQYPVLAAKMTAAELKGLQFVQKNFTNAQAVYDKMQPSFTATTPAATWAAGWGWNASSFTATGLIAKKDLVNLANLMSTYGLIPQGASAKIQSDVVNPKVLKAAFTSLGQSMPKQPNDQALLAMSPN